jgi:hypothetical protein
VRGGRQPRHFERPSRVGWRTKAGLFFRPKRLSADCLWRDDPRGIDCDDLLVVDEASMVDVMLMQALTKAVPRFAIQVEEPT